MEQIGHHAALLTIRGQIVPANEPLEVINLDRFSLIAFYSKIFVTELYIILKQNPPIGSNKRKSI